MEDLDPIVKLIYELSKDETILTSYTLIKTHKTMCPMSKYGRIWSLIDTYMDKYGLRNHEQLQAMLPIDIML